MKPKFKPGDRFIHNGEIIGTIAEVCDTYYKITDVEYTFPCKVPCKHTTFDIAQQKYLTKLSPKPKYKVGDLVTFDDLIGRITEVVVDEDKWLHLYRVGNHFPLIYEYYLQKVDWRDEVKILGKRNNNV